MNLHVVTIKSCVRALLPRTWVDVDEACRTSTADLLSGQPDQNFLDVTMQATLEIRYARLEKALDTLVESIASYNPSTAAADELVAADQSVNTGLRDRTYSTLRLLASH